MIADKGERDSDLPFASFLVFFFHNWLAGVSLSGVDRRQTRKAANVGLGFQVDESRPPFIPVL
ncbi:hypothetical protein N658DRAFT_490872 [Parathielavia hyrcaniae]|uniref:Uncharacterized protein n=1 Tax=Parathielavia hyrcaniae TaxID=113614 RepID=A0AAN6Q9S3_9PEZI|nr:hypothetical protein N658DRAFT_490872 [Parathielavia hyrcaniae]